MKYIVFKKGQRTVIRVFMGAEPHFEIADEFNAVGTMRKVMYIMGVGALNIGERHALSAGFVGIDSEGKPYAYGESDSLRLKADVERDTALLRALWRNAATRVAMDPP